MTTTRKIIRIRSKKKVQKLRKGHGSLVISCHNRGYDNDGEDKKGEVVGA